MARTSRPGRSPRNTAPLWKKLTVVFSAPVAALVVMRVLNTTEWPFVLFLVVEIGAAALAVWGTARFLGVRLSLGSWD